VAVGFQKAPLRLEIVSQSRYSPALELHHEAATSIFNSLNQLLCMRVLLLEGKDTEAQLVGQHLAYSGFSYDEVASIEDAAQALVVVSYAAIVLDLDLPGQDALKLLRDLRSRQDATPVLIVSTRNAVVDRVASLREGADDYLVKPFSLDELVARLHALLRRPRKLLEKILTAGNITLDSLNHQVNIDDRVIPMRLREVLMLEILMRQKNSVVSRRYFEDQLFGIDGEQDSNTIEVYIHRLRLQLLEAGGPIRVHTIRGVGYMLVDNDSSREESNTSQATQEYRANRS
jgi:DNA-binding response OmpR family regulator